MLDMVTRILFWLGPQARGTIFCGGSKIMKIFGDLWWKWKD